MKKIIFYIVSVLLSILYCLSTYDKPSVQAQSFVSHLPTFSLYCENSNIIQRGEVTYDTSNFTPSIPHIMEYSTYTVSATKGQTITFSVPFISSVIDVPDFHIQANGKNVEGEVLYGDNVHYFSDNFDVSAAFSKIRSSNPREAIGTLYLFTPEADTFTVDSKLSPQQSIIYQTTNRMKGSESSGYFSRIFENAQSGAEYSFFVTNGDLISLNVTGATFTKETISCKAYAEKYYTLYKEFYDDSGAPAIEFLYSQINKVLENTRYYEFDEIFISSLGKQSFNTYNFSVYAEHEVFSIVYDMLAEVQINDFYSPAIYMIEQRKTGNYPTDYRFCLSGEYPYLQESATTVEKEDTMYKTTVSSKKFYYVFCSSENPTDLTTEQKYTEQNNKIMTIVLFSLICITILVFIVSITKLILSNTKKH